MTLIKAVAQISIKTQFFNAAIIDKAESHTLIYQTIECFNSNCIAAVKQLLTMLFAVEGSFFQDCADGILQKLNQQSSTYILQRVKFFIGAINQERISLMQVI